jgi:anti-anti-sigma regulatory factor
LLKVTTTKDEGGRTVLKLEGRLADSWVDELARVAAVATNGGAQMIFDLEGLSFVDVRGLALLRGAAERGARLTGGSPFVAALIDQERPA